MLGFILSIRLWTVAIDVEQNDKLYNDNTVAIHNVFWYAYEEAQKLGKECLYEYGTHWNDDYIAVDGYCYVDYQWYPVILIAKYSEGTNKFWDKKYNWRRYWKHNYIPQNKLPIGWGGL